MSRRIEQQKLAAHQEIVAAPAAEARACDDHSFELPNGIYVAMFAMLLGAVAVLATAFSGQMIVSYGIVVAFLLAFFAVLTIFVKASPGNGAMSWDEFLSKGIDTATGRTGAGEATVLALALPFFIFCWATGVATIAATVR